MAEASTAPGVAEGARRLLAAVGRAVVGYEREARLLLAALVAGGHVLLEGVPGVAKTTLVKALARAMGLVGYEREVLGARFRGFSRIQFTPDLLPSDVTGSLVWNPREARLEPQLGPVFAYLVLADEINRASPRTQSALLEAMQEKQVTIAGETYRLEDLSAGKWFAVAATQNPVEQEGTYPLPEAQLDRFTVRLLFGYPESLEDEIRIYRLGGGEADPLDSVEAVVGPEWLARARLEAARVEAPPQLLDAAARLVRLTRPEHSELARDYFELGASPRAGVMLIRVAKALAAVRGARSASLEDLAEAAWPVLNHRLIPRAEALVERGATASARLSLVREGLDAAARAALGRPLA